MIVSIQPSVVSGTVKAPASKSATQRAYAAALVRAGESFIHHPGSSTDERAALDVITQLGAHVSLQDEVVHIRSKGIAPVNSILNCGESGLSARMFTPIAALASTAVTINGSGTLLSRPMDFFEVVMPQLDVKIESADGRLPVTVQGPLRPRDITVDGSQGSQYLTGLLFAYSAAGAAGVSISVENLKSRPYIDLTLEVMQSFALQVPLNKDYHTFLFEETGHFPLQNPIHYTIEGDWSGAAFLLVAGAIAGSVRIEGLKSGSSQADRRVIDALAQAGAGLVLQEGFIEVSRQSLRPFHFDATDCPDLFPPLVALAAHCKGRTVIKGLHRLKYKESDRGITLQREFAKLGTDIGFDGDEMIIKGNDKPVSSETVLDSHHDHRIAMACAVASLNSKASVVIRNADAVKKSYPEFWDHLRQLNAELSLKPFTTGNTFSL